MKLRRLNTLGIAKMESFLDSLGTETPDDYPSHVLTDSTTSEELSSDVEIEKRVFKTRLDAAEYLDVILRDSEIDGFSTDKGLWAWLALFYFEQLCPIDSDGRRIPRERARWIPAFSDARRYYRHLLAGPYRVYVANCDAPERAMILLYGPLTTLGHFAYQVASRQEFVTNKAVLELATELYLDVEREKPKRGSQTHGRPGSVFRFVDFLNQLDATWDLYSLSKDNLAAMLPPEFDRFRNAAE